MSPAKDLGTRHACYECGTKFYDLKKPAPICPKCGADQRENPALKEPVKAPKKAAAPAPRRVVEEEEREVDEEESLEEDDDEGFDDDVADDEDEDEV